MQPSKWQQRALLCVWVGCAGALGGSCDDEPGKFELTPPGGDDAGSDPGVRDAGNDASARDAALDARAAARDGELPRADASDGGAELARDATADGELQPSDAARADATVDDAASDAATLDAQADAAIADAAVVDATVDAAVVDAAVDAAVVDAGSADAAAVDAGLMPVDGGACTLTANTYLTGKSDAYGCNLLVRDSSSCASARTAAGLSGFWLKFSCRVSLSVLGNNVTASTVDNQPDYKSNYFQTNNACYEVFNGKIQNPNRITAQPLSIVVPRTPGTQGGPKMGDVVGMALNGVAIFGNYAAPGDDIYTEARTFDRCSAHPQNTGKYHYHSEPASITQDDSNFVGVMLDGYPVYGRRDEDGSLPSNLDGTGGHTGATPDSATPVYHYHVNLQTSTAAGTLGDMQWFLTKGMMYHGAPGSCLTCF